MNGSTSHTVKKLIYKCDFFSQKIGFRFKQDSQYSTLTGGIASILLIITFFIVFTNTTLNTLNKDSISTQSFQTFQQDPSLLSLNSVNHFFFAMGLTNINMISGIRYFDIHMTQTQYKSTGKTKSALNLVPCNRSVWADFKSQQILKAYDTIGMDSWLCPKQEQSFQMKGKYTSDIFKFIKIGIQKCNDSLDLTRRCATDAQIQTFLDSNSQFSLNIYFVNTLINPSQKKFISYYLEDRYYFPFTLQYGLNANLFFSNYQIQTDESIWPNQNQNKTSGATLTDNGQFFPVINTGTEYLKVYLRKASNFFKYTRSFRKLDDTFSYIGGLFSSIVCFLLVIGFYNQYSYELQIAKNIYKYDEQTLLDTNKFHFLSYLLYLVYSFLSLIGLQPKWSQMEHYDHSLNEVRKQMDIRLIFKKLFFIQKIANIVLQQNQIKGLHLQDKITMKKAQEMRRNYLLPKILVDKMYQQIKLKEQKQKEKQSQSQCNSETSSAFNFQQKNAESLKGKNQRQENQKNCRYNVQMISDQIKEDNEINVEDIEKIDQNQEKNKKQLKSVKLKNFLALKDALTNSVHSYRSHKTNGTLIQILQIINRLKDDSQKGNLYSKNILQNISPQIKKLLNLQGEFSDQALSVEQNLKQAQNHQIQYKRSEIKFRKQLQFGKSMMLKSIRDIIVQKENTEIE